MNDVVLSLQRLYQPTATERLAEIRIGLLAAADALAAAERSPTVTTAENLTTQLGGLARSAAGLLHNLRAD